MWYEDITVGAKRELGEYTFTEGEMIAFARKYDPQTFHTDPEAAKHSIFGGLIGSGWLTTAIFMKLTIAHATPGKGGMAISPGFEDLRWLKPVRPGTTLAYSMEITGKSELKSRPNFGLVLGRCEARDKSGELYMSMTTKVLWQKREVAS